MRNTIDTTDAVAKPKGLFDHITHIKQIQDPNYIDTLTSSDMDSFTNRYMILRALSMDKKIINTLADIAVYEKILDHKTFYRLLISKIPKNYKYHKYIKKTNVGFPSGVIKCLQTYFGISKKDASDYYITYLYKENGLNTLIDIITKCGYTEEEANKLFDE